MAKLYPPYIEGTIPAFYKTVDSDGTVRAELTVPFSMNKAVSKWEVRGFSLKLKNVFGDDSYLISTTTAADPNSRYNLDANYKVVFSLNEFMLSKLTIGQCYKVQIAYISDDAIGYYSTVGVVKYTTEPSMEISGLSTEVINMHRYSYVGKYAQVAYDYREVDILRQDYKPNVYYILNEKEEFVLATSELYTPPYYTKVPTLDIEKMKDATEKTYNYRFILTDFKGNVVADSGYLLHNSNNDLNSYESQNEFSFPSDLQNGKIYYIQYSVITNNNLEVFSPKYRIMQKRSIAPEIYATVKAEMNYENGYVDIKLIGEQDADGMEKGATGSFLLARSCSDDNFTVWSEILRFGLHGQRPSRDLYRDFTVEQGKTYMYSLQQYNDTGLYSARIKSNEIYADFEDAFLFDGTRQLKIKYNPKISSFKTGYLETKVNTIGSQFPFIFRNGNVAYKEFPLSGLISYQSDEMNLFMKDADLGLDGKVVNEKRPGSFRDDIEISDRYFEDLFNLASGKPYSPSSSEDIKIAYEKRKNLKDNIDECKVRTTNLVSYNILAERKFKLEVLDWLNNGKAKLFRSPTEGNYLIRLMNVSLTPEEKTGRMLHTFSSTAYEIAECTYENLNVHGIISIGDPQYQSLRWESIRLAEYEEKESDSRYEPNFSYELIKNLTEERFNALVKEAENNALLPYYNKLDSGQFVQVKATDPYDMNADYHIKNSAGVLVGIESLNEEAYNQTVADVKNNTYLSFYRKEYNILGQEVYKKVKTTDSYNYWVEVWEPLKNDAGEIVYRPSESGEDLTPVMVHVGQDLYEDYYSRKDNGYLYYAKANTNLLEAREVTSLRLTDMTPGDIFYLQLEGWGKPEAFMIGATGSYLVDTDVNIIYFALPPNVKYTGTLTYSYYEDTVNLFNEIENVEIASIAAQQFVGAQENIVKQIENIRDTILNFYYINVYKRSIGEAFYNADEDKLYRRHSRVLNEAGEYENVYSDLISSSIPPHNGESLDGVNDNPLIEITDSYFEDPFMLYHYTRDNYFNASAWTKDPNDPNVNIYEPFNFYYDPLNPKQSIVSQETFDRIAKQKVTTTNLQVYSTNIYFDNHKMSIEETQHYYAQSEEFVFDSIVCDAGVAIEIGYELQSVNYSIMRNDPVVAEYYAIYLENKQILEKAKSIENLTEDKINEIITAQQNLRTSYLEFIEVLTEALRIWEAEQVL